MFFRKTLVVLLFFSSITLAVFYQYFLHGRIPFPANLHVAYFEPWKSYPDPDYPQGPPNKPIGFDNLRVHYPYRTLAMEQWKSGTVPLWNPYAFSGAPLLANYQSASTHPLGLAYFFLLDAHAWSVVVVAQVFLMLFLSYIFFRLIGAGRLAGVLGSLTLTLGHTSFVWWQEAYMAGYTIVGLFIVLIGIELLRRRVTWWNVAIIFLGTSWMITAGWFQFLLYAGAFILFWITYRTYTGHKWRLPIAWFALAVSMGVMISSIHLIPAMEMYQLSGRKALDAKYLFDSYLKPPSHLSTLIAPDYYGSPATYNFFGSGFYYEHVMSFGIVGLILVLIFALTNWRKKEALFLLAAWVGMLTLGLNTPLSWFLLYQLKLPIVSVIIPSRIFIFAAIAAGILTVKSAQNYLHKPKWWAVVVTAGIAAWSFWYLYQQTEEVLFADPFVTTVLVSRRNMVLPAAAAGVTLVVLLVGSLRASFSKFAIIGLIIITIAVGGYNTRKYLYFSEQKFLYQQNPVITNLNSLTRGARFWSFGKGKIESNFPTVYRLPSIEGYDSLFPVRYAELVSFASAEENAERKERADAVLHSSDRIDRLLTPKRERLLKLLGVTHIAGFTKKPDNVDEEIKPPESLTNVWNDDIYAIYSLKGSLPRTYMVGNAETIAESEKILARLFDPSFDPAKSVITSVDLGLKNSKTGSGEARIASYAPHKIEIESTSDQPAALVLSDTYHPGWKAYIDGKENPVYQANYTLRTVVVPSGSHKVVMKYQPQSFAYGAILSGVGIVLGTIVLLYLKQKSSVPPYARHSVYPPHAAA